MKQFDGKVIYCPCDRYRNGNRGTSAFIEFFLNRRDSNIMKIKKLIASSYNRNGEVSTYFTWTPDMGEEMERHDFKISDGDFRSEECIELLREADIVVTNPPFSLFREFTDLLVKYDKKFLIIGNMNAITYKEFFPLIKENKVWAGYGFNKTIDFIMPDDYELKKQRLY